MPGFDFPEPLLCSRDNVCIPFSSFYTLGQPLYSNNQHTPAYTTVAHLFFISRTSLFLVVSSVDTLEPLLPTSEVAVLSLLKVGKELALASCELKSTVQHGTI